MSVFRVLIPTDFSPSSDAALSLGIQFAQANSPARVFLAHILASPPPPHLDQLGVLDPPTLHSEMKMLSASREHGVPFETIVRHGDPAEEILRLMEKLAPDLVVMGTQGRSAITQLLLGSVAQTVMRDANCPVATVRLGTSQHPPPGDGARPADRQPNSDNLDQE